MKTSKENQGLFVYGTLMTGECRHYLIQQMGGYRPQAAWVPGCLVDLGSFPGLLPAETPTDVVPGEYYEFDLKERDWLQSLARLDREEGFIEPGHRENLYERRWTPIEGSRGAQLNAWVYWYVGEQMSARRLPGNRWPGQGRTRD